MMPFEMTFNQKLKQMVRIKNLIIFCLILILIWWGGIAVLKYWSQPLTTDTSYLFGDNENGIRFPIVTICDSEFYHKNSLLKNCHTKHWDLIHSYVSCMKKDKTFLIETFMDSLQLDVRKIVTMVRVWTGSEYIILQDLYGQAWSKIFNYAFGFCHTFDLSKIDKFEYVSYQEILRPGLEFVMSETNKLKKPNIMLHTKNDLPDAVVLNGFHQITFSNKTKQAYKLALKKKIHVREPTRKVPCMKYEYNTCQNIEDNRLILEKFHCSIPILYSGQHLDDFIPKNVLNCSNDAIKEGLNFISKKKSRCKQVQTCEMTRFTSTYKVTENMLAEGNESVIWLAFANPEVLYQNTYISYDLISLVGEVGGILGLTLGASTLTLLESLLQHLHYY